MYKLLKREGNIFHMSAMRSSVTSCDFHRTTGMVTLASVLVIMGFIGVAHAQTSAPRPTSAQVSQSGSIQRPPVSVVVARSVLKDLPVRLDAIGKVQPFASVTVRSRVDSQISEVLFQDGASVKTGDVLFRLDARQIDTQIRQAEANVARDRANLSLAEADLKRAEALAKRDFGTEQRLDTTRSNVASLKAAIRANEAALDNLKVQQTFYTITAPITGRIGAAGLKVGNTVRSGDNVIFLGTINQIKPTYVNFALPQQYLNDIKQALSDTTAQVIATPEGSSNNATGTLAFIDNMIDPLTGTIGVRAIFENKDESLWPGASSKVRLTLRVEKNVLTVPRSAVVASQSGSLVFVIETDGEQQISKSRPITVVRSIDGDTIVASGLKVDDMIVVDGQNQLTDGAKIRIKESETINNPSQSPDDKKPRKASRPTVE